MPSPEDLELSLPPCSPLTQFSRAWCFWKGRAGCWKEMSEHRCRGAGNGINPVETLVWQAQLPLPALLFPLSAPHPEGQNSSKAKGLELCHPWAPMSHFVTSTAAGAAHCCRNSVFSPGISPNSPLPFSCTSQPKQDSQEKRNAGTETSEEVGKSSWELPGGAAALGALILLWGVPIPL